MEEQEMMFLQQGLGDAMREHVMRHRLCGGHVNFDNQEINRNLAQMSSIDRSFATLDMKEASDRISKDLVRLIFAKLPKLRDCLMALSAPNIQLPSGRSIRARKFAPMGSSLCFPIMSVVHYALAVASIHRATGRRTSLIAKDVYVYGDDIIVKSEYTEPLFTDFPKFGLMFNRGKSFKNGHFRESCGMDAFRGVDVSPQRLKRRYFDGQDPRNVSAVMDMHNALYDKGFVGMASMLQVVTESRYGSFPYVSKDSDVLGWQHKPPLSPDVIDIISYEGSSKDCSFLCNLLVTPEERKQFELLTPIWDSDLHDYTISARVMRTEPECSMLGGWEQLMRSNLQAHRSSARLDGRWSRKFIEYQRQPLSAIYGGSSKFLPR